MKKKFLIIAIVGPDGSGKTLLINHLKKKLYSVGLKNKRIHLKPSLFRSKITKVSNPHSKPPRSRFMSILKLIFWLFSYYVFYILNLINGKKEIFFFDRYVHDIIVDPLRYRINLNRKTILFLLNLFPIPDFWCFMTGDANQIWSRKKEVKFEILKTQLSKYKKLKVKFKNSLSISKKKQFDVVFNIIQKKYRSINK